MLVDADKAREKLIGRITEYLSHDAVRDLLMDCRTELKSLSAQVAELKKELGIRTKTDPVTRLHNLCRGLEHEKKDGPYSAEAWDQLIAENDDMRKQCAGLKKDADRYCWLKNNLRPEHFCAYMNFHPSMANLLGKESIDAAIDAAKEEVLRLSI